MLPDFASNPVLQKAKMSGNSKIGFSVTCYRGDYPLAKACVASIRYFAPDAPILVIADGDFPTKDIERAYGVKVLRRRDVQNDELRQYSFGGYGYSKLIAFWEAPFDIIVHVDADAVLWGDIRKNLPSGDWDVVFNEPHEVITPFIQRTQYFDPERIFDHIPPFPWQGCPFFNTGVIVVRRGVLDLDEYMRLLQLHREYPELMPCGEQGILNILVFRAALAGKIKALPGSFTDRCSRSPKSSIGRTL